MTTPVGSILGHFSREIESYAASIFNTTLILITIMNSKIESFIGRAAIAITLVFSTVSTAKAGVIYDERINGDAPSAFGSAFVGADVGTLLPGTNTILADGEFGTNDDFIFSIGEGTSLVGITFFLGIRTENFFIFGADLYTREGVMLSNQLNTEGVDVISFGAELVPFFADALDLGPGTYRIDNNASGGRGQFFWPYGWNLIVQSTNQVPEPASGLLVALGMGLLGAGRYRR